MVPFELILVFPQLNTGATSREQRPSLYSLHSSNNWTARFTGVKKTTMVYQYQVAEAEIMSKNYAQFLFCQ
jgi:hypothetical protein